jgi:phospholipid/cholesterol/gamma-HCH transport system substrate-binding protein
MNRAQQEIVVGGFVVAAFVVLMWGTMQIGAFPGVFGSAGQMHLVARFDNVAGLDLETDVLIAGVPVGKVAKVALDGHHARVTLRIESPDASIPMDSVVAIRSRGLLGERVIEIVPGDATQMMADGGAFTRTQAAANVDLLVDRLTDIAADIKEVSTTFRNVLGDPEGEEAMYEIVANLRAVSTDLRRVVEENEKGIERVVKNLDSFSSDLAQLTDGNRQQIDEMLKGLHAASGKLNDTLDVLVELSAKVERGEGTLGKLLDDGELYMEVDAAIADARATLREVRRAAEETQEQIPVTILSTVFGSLF